MMIKTPPILITGASSGIGNHLTNYLSTRGHVVYATARKDDDLKTLGKIGNVTPIKLDVRDPQQIRDAFHFIVNEGKGLYGLVNNAGIGGLGMFSTWTDEEILDIFNVNVFGVHRITNAFIGLLIESKGRIVNIGSQGGIITSTYYGPYTMTKHALEAYTESLNRELEPYGVRVSIVQPGGIVTRAGLNSIEGTLARFHRAAPPFTEEAEQVLANFNRPSPPEEEEESETNRKPSSPEIVSIAVYDALFSERPKPRYLVGTKWEGDRVINALIGQLLDENDNPQHHYSRDELVALLDRHLFQRSNNLGDYKAFGTN
jgi:short-subunit dehydrogenase